MVIIFNAILVNDHEVIIIVLLAAITRVIFSQALSSHTGKVVFTPQAFPKISLLGAHLFCPTVEW